MCHFVGRVGLFGRKANPYVKATYGSVERLSPTYVCDNDSPLSDKALVFNVTDVNSLVSDIQCKRRRGEGKKRGEKEEK